MQGTGGQWGIRERRNVIGDLAPSLKSAHRIRRLYELSSQSQDDSASGTAEWADKGGLGNERKYMEANRERAEEVYKEERALMEGRTNREGSRKGIALARDRVPSAADIEPGREYRTTKERQHRKL